MGKYINRGLSQIYFTPSLTSQSAPSIAEVEDGTDLTGRITEINGFVFSSTAVETPTLDSTFTTSIAGVQETEDSSLVVYDIDDAVDPVKTALGTLNTNGFIIIATYGLDATKKCEVWPVRVGSYSTAKTMDNEAAKSTISFFPTAVPTTSATLAA